MEQARIKRIEVALNAVLPAGVACAVMAPDAGMAAAYAIEAAAMRTAVSKRRAEFFTGRAAARRAMYRMGIAPVPVPMGEDRAPVWPAGVVGSISHCDEVCVALIGRAKDWRSLSVDVEPTEDLPCNLWDIVLGSKERARLAQLPDAAQGRRGRLIFSAKEAVYKLQFPITGNWMDFSELDITVTAAETAFDARFCGRVVPDFARAGIQGQILGESGFKFCLMFLS